MGSAQVPFVGNLGGVARAALFSGQLVLVMVCGYLTVLDSKNQAAVEQGVLGVKVGYPHLCCLRTAKDNAKFANNC